MPWKAAALAVALAACTGQGTPPAAAQPPAALVGQWNGSWDASLPTTLVVERVGAGAASVIYEWGVAPAWKIDIPGYERSVARFDAGRLVVFLTNGAVATYMLQADGTLHGTYRFRGRIAHATLRQ